MLELCERFGISPQLGERGATQREREARFSKRRACPVGELQCLILQPADSQQLEILGPTCPQLWFGGEQLVVRRLCILRSSLARQPAGTRQRALAASVGKQIVGCGCAHWRVKSTRLPLAGYTAPACLHLCRDGSRSSAARAERLPPYSFSLDASRA